MKLNILGLLGASVGALCIAMPAFAQQEASSGTQTAEGTTDSRQIGEIIVTAERRASSAQSMPASVSVRLGEDLAEQGKYSTRQILEDIPGLTAQDNNSLNVGSSDVQGNNITIRGITPGTSAGGGPSQISASAGAAVYVDGVYEGVGGNFDIERVEVLRGPQGTLYGRSATTGVVSFITRNPRMDEFSGDALVEFGDYDLQHYSAGLNIPLAEGLAARVSGDFRDQGEGYFGDSRRGMTRRGQGRIKLLWEPSDNFSLLAGFAADSDKSYSGGQTMTIAPATLVITTRTTAVYESVKQQRQYWAEANWDLGPVAITYLPAFRTWTQDDLKFTSANFLSSGFGQNQIIKTPQNDFHTQELRVASNGDSSIQWLAGAFYYHNVLDTQNRNFLVKADGTEQALVSDASDQKDTESIGFFAESTITLTDSLRVTLGARYDWTTVKVDEFLQDNPYARCGTSSQANVTLPTGVVCTGAGQASAPPPAGNTISVELPFSNFNYKGRIEYDLTPENMIYAMISTGFRPGDAGIASGVTNIVGAEKLTSFEFGSKNRFFDDSLQLNLGAFYYKYEGFRTSYRRDTDAGLYDFTGAGSAININVPARNLGGEVELLFRPTANDRIGINYNYVQSRWHDKPEEFAKAQPEERRALRPHTISANYEHVFEMPDDSTIRARIDGRYEGAYLERNLHADYLRLGYEKYVYQDSRLTGNLTGTWSSADRRFSVSAYVRNFTNEIYSLNDVRGDRNSFTLLYSDPRTYGVVVTAGF